MGVRSKIAAVLTACPLILSACERAEIALDDLRPKAGRAAFIEHGSDAGGTAGASSGGTGSADAPGGAMDMAGSGGQDELDQDTTPPRVLSTSPAHGERGVRSDAPIVIRFSEPMDRDQTARAVVFGGGPVMVVEWDELGTKLSLVPFQKLEYGRGPDPAYVKAPQYSVSVHRSATDVAGNALGKDYTTTFYTSRVLPRALPQIEQLMGYVIDSDNPRASAVAADPSVGDALDRSEKGFISFDLSVLPPDTQAVTSATLTATQHTVAGEPYEMGSMLLEHVSFSALQFVPTAPTKTSFGVLFADAATPTATMDVTSAVQAQLAEGGDDADQVQFRFVFERASNPNGVSDDVRLLPVELDVTYLAP